MLIRDIIVAQLQINKLTPNLFKPFKLSNHSNISLPIKDSLISKGYIEPSVSPYLSNSSNGLKFELYVCIMFNIPANLNFFSSL